MKCKPQSLRHVKLILASVIIWLASTGVSFAQFVGVQYGPRAFSTAPSGTQAVSLTYDEMDLGIGVNGILLSRINNKAVSAYATYLRYFSLKGKTASLQFSLPYVDIKSNVETTCCGTHEGLSGSGITDPYMQFNVALIGGESLSPREFFQTEPGFVMSLHTGVRFPVGEYDVNQPLNIGANRFEVRVGFPMSYTWGTPTKQTSLEFVPLVYGFEDNADPFGADNLSQDPVIQFEAHITHDFLPALWGALNANYVIGGETETDGVLGNNALDYKSVGLTVGGRLSKTMGYTLTYGRRLDSKNTTDDGNLLRLGLTYTF